MTTPKPRINNAIKAQARAYQKANPGTTYTAAREAVLNPTTPDVSPLSSSWLVGQPEAKRVIKALRDMEGVKAKAASRAWEARLSHLGDHIPPAPPYSSFPKVWITGPPGSGRTSAALTIHDEVTVAAEGRRLTTVSAASFIGRYAGEAQSLIQPVVEKAERGTLIIENLDAIICYDDPFRAEAIIVLTEELRLVRHNIAVTVISEGSGLALPLYLQFLATFNTRVPLTSITPEDASGLARKFAKESRLLITDDAVAVIRERIEELRSPSVKWTTLDRSQNARLVKSVVDFADVNLMQRLAATGDVDKLSAEDLTTLTSEDIHAAWEAAVAE